MSYPAKILITDDEKGMLLTLSAILEDEGYQVVGCQNGNEAIRYLSTEMGESPVDLVISDLKLTDMSGLAILSHLKQVSSDAAFIVITGNATTETAIEAVNQGAFPYHIKPLGIDALTTSINNALRQKSLLTENRNLLEQVQQSEIKYRTLVEKANAGIFTMEPSTGGFIDVNLKMEEISGRSRESLLNMTLPMLCSESMQSNAPELLCRTLEQGQASINDLYFERPNGDEICVDLNTTLVEYHGKKVILGIARDVTERKATEEHIRETSKLVSVGKLAAGVAHEINNPLTVVMGFSQILMNQGQPEAVESRLQGIFLEAERAAKIVKNLLSFARKHEPEKQYVSVTTVLERALELKAPDFRINNIALTSQWDQDLPYTMADDNQLIEVILNIVTNAEPAMIEANNGGALVVGASVSEGNIRISISDNGPGIPPERRHEIFDPFFTTKEVGKGTGLGLSISYGIIKLHGGDIWVESDLGIGTTFHIEIPILSPSGVLEIEEPEKQPTPAPDKPMHVLVVDDEANIRKLAASLLSLESCTVDLAENGNEAWHKLQSDFYDCIILDLKMPGMGGEELYWLIEGSNPEQASKVIFVTGDIASQETSKFISGTGNLSLSKPFNIAEFRDLVFQCGSRAKEEAKISPESVSLNV